MRLLASLCIAALAMMAPQSAASISGVVTDVTSKSPIVGARVLVMRADAPIGESQVATADEQGRFIVRNVTAGTYRLFADDPDYLRREAAGPVTLQAGQSVRDVAIALTRTAVIAGRVVTERGDPAPKIYVRAFAMSKTPVFETTTNDLGEFRLFGLAPGSYVVSAERYLAPFIEGARYSVPTPPCPDCPGEGRGMMGLDNLMKTGAFIDPRVIANRSYPAVFYPATTDRATATAIPLAPGVQVNIELRLIVATR